MLRLLVTVAPVVALASITGVAAAQWSNERMTDPYYEGPDVQGRFSTDVVDDRRALFSANRLYDMAAYPETKDWYGYFEDAYDDDDWYYDYHAYDFDDSESGGRDYITDEHGVVGPLREPDGIRWFRGYDAAAEAALSNW